jgi:hypothetical protein
MMGVINTLPFDKSALTESFSNFTVIRAIHKRQRDAPVFRLVWLCGHGRGSCAVVILDSSIQLMAL